MFAAQTFMAARTVRIRHMELSMFSSHRFTKRPQRLSFGGFSAIALAVVVGSISFSLSAFARGGMFHSHDPWSPEHIDQLPVEIRNAVKRICSGSSWATHNFATYFQNSHLIKLHFEKFQCDSKEPFCTPVGCLHQTYVLSGSQYRLSSSYYAPGTD
jgi:hypothetical protein